MQILRHVCSVSKTVFRRGPHASSSAPTPSARHDAALLREARREAHGLNFSPPRSQQLRGHHEQASDAKVYNQFRKRQRHMR